MEKKLLYVLLFCFTIPQIFSQDNGVVELALPVRNSLKFNKQVLNPTFSFVREQNSYISISNKRQTQFEGSPQAYMVGYAGRISENNGAGVTLFQRDYGVFTNFGGIVNFAHNIQFSADNNLTFGLNVGAYKSGLNRGNVVSNYDDPSLENVPDNFLVTIAPGINYGMTFFDIGVSVNNLVSYNASTSEPVAQNPEQAVQLHAMYTGYLDARGFFHDTKFSTLVRSEFKKAKTVLSGLMMLTVPKGLWGQLGYNTLYGASVGIGLNLTEQIALEYNYEQSISDFFDFGTSHEVTLAYRFNKKRRFKYGDDDEEVAIFGPKKKKRRNTAVAKAKNKTLPKNPVVKEKEEVKETPIVAQNNPVEVPEESTVAIDTTTVSREAARPVAIEKVAAKPVIDNKKAVELTTPKLEEIKPVVVAQEEKEMEAPVEEQSPIHEELVEITNDFNKKREELITNLEEKVDSKQADLEAMKRENDLSEKGVYVEPRPFKSISAENAAIEAAKVDLENFIDELNFQITHLEEVYITVKKKDGANSKKGIHYLNTIEKLKAEKLRTIARKENLEKNLERIEVATEVERKRRIKRALYDDDQDRYLQDRAIMKKIVETTPVGSESFTEEDFDLGDVPSSGIQILKDVKNTDPGYYLVVAVHTDTDKRNDVLRKIVASGEQNIDFFYDVNTSKYYIYYKKYNDLNLAQGALKEKGNKPYNNKMTLIKIE